MSTKIEKIEGNIVKLEIRVEADKFNEAVKKSYSKNSKKFNIPGFRKGKAPMNMIKKFYGEGVFYEDAINICCENTYPAALDENSIKPVDYPEIDVVEVGEGKELVYTATVTVYPEVILGEYKGVEVKKIEYIVTEEEIETQIKSMQEKNSRVEAKIDGTVENGNIAVIDFKGYVDGVAFEGGEGKDYSLEIGSGSFIGDFETQLIGLKTGVAKNISVTFPEQYGKEELNGKLAVFEVTIKEIKVKELPGLDADFVKEVSEFDTVEELKADLRKKAEEANELKSTREIEDAVIDTVCANAKVEIPKIMIKKEIETMMKDFEMRLKYQGLDLKTYFEYTNNNEESMKEYMKESAEKRVKTELIMTKLSKELTFEISDKEILFKANEMAKQYGDKDIEKTVKLIVEKQKEYIKADIVNEKIIKMLVDSSKIIA